MYRVGGGRQADVLRANVEIAKMVQDTLRMQAMREAMTARLNALLDRDEALGMGAPSTASVPRLDASPSTARGDAAGDRPLIRAAVEEVSAADASARLARKEIIPDLASACSTDSAARGTVGGGTERMGSLMFGASIPVFARDRQLRMREEAGAMRQMAQADLAACALRRAGRSARRTRTSFARANLAQLYRSDRTSSGPGDRRLRARLRIASASVDFMTLLDDRMTVNKYRQELYALRRTKERRGPSSRC